MSRPEKPTASIHVLAAEDSESQAAKLRYILEREGFSVDIASNGRVALEMAAKRRPDIVICDVVMPEMDGYAFCQALRAEESLRDIPVILVTGLNGPQDVFKGLDCGADNFIVKPYEGRYLLARIQHLLANRELRHGKNVRIGIEINLGGKRHFISAERQQILDLLISTYDEAVHLSEELALRQGELTQSYRTLNVLFQLAEALNGCRTEVEVAAQALRQATRLHGVRGGWLYLNDGDNGLRLAGSVGLASAEIGDDEAGTSCRCKERLRRNELREPCLIECDRRPAGASAPLRHASAPILTNGAAAGILNLVPADGYEFDDGALKILANIGNQIGTAVERARLQENLARGVDRQTAALRQEMAERQRAEKATQVAERRLRDAIESTGVGFSLYDVDDRLELINEAARRLSSGLDDVIKVGVRFEDVVRAGVERGVLAPPGDPEEYIRNRVAIHRLADGKPREIPMADGRWVQTRERRTADGGIVGSRTDITETKRAQAALARNAERQAALAELGQRALGGTPLPRLMEDASEFLAQILDVDLVKCFELSADGRQLRLVAGYGWKEGTLGTDNLYEVRMGSPAGRAVLSGTPTLVEDWQSETRFEQWPTLADHGVRCGAVVPIPGPQSPYGAIGVDSRALRRFTDDDILFLGGMATVIGIAMQRQHHEQRLSQINEEMIAVIERSPVAIVSIDAQACVTVWSNAAVATFGYSRDEVIGRPYPLVPPGGEKRFNELFDAVRAGQRLQNADVRRQCKNGALLDVLVSSTPLYGADGVFRGAVFVLENITERRKIEEQLRQAQKMDAIGNLTGGIAHDFNNLLLVMLGNLDHLVGRVKGNKDAADLVEAAIEAAERGAELTKHLLAFARRQPLQPKQIDVNKLVQGMTRLLTRTLGGQIEIKIDLDPGAWPVRIDPAQLESALLNLAVNARDAMPRGGSLLVAIANRHLDADYVRLNTDAAVGDYVAIEVTDTGVGMPPEVLQHAFEPFFTTKGPGKGTGLGLAMVFGFIKQSGGHVSVYSEVGRGTTFRLYLPRLRAAPGAEEDAKIKIVAATPAHETVLVVEDDAKVRPIVVRSLIELGYRVIEADCAAAALVELRKGAAIDLLFTDVVMPGGMDGTELARQAVAERPGLKVLLTSGFPDAVFKAASTIANDVQLLSKPYRKDELALKLRAVLEQGPQAGEG